MVSWLREEVKISLSPCAHTCLPIVSSITVRAVTSKQRNQWLPILFILCDKIVVVLLKASSLVLAVQGDTVAVGSILVRHDSTVAVAFYYVMRQNRTQQPKSTQRMHGWQQQSSTYNISPTPCYNSLRLSIRTSTLWPHRVTGSGVLSLHNNTREVGYFVIISLLFGSFPCDTSSWFLRPLITNRLVPTSREAPTTP